MLIFGDCLELMKDLPDVSVQMVLADLPYGTTNCHWDSQLPLDLLWVQYKRLCINCGGVDLFHKLGSMFLQMISPRQAAKIVYFIIQCVSVMVMYHMTIWYFTEVRLPHKHSTSYPCAWFSSLDECSLFPGFVQINTHCADRDLSIRFAAFLELRSWRNMNSLDALVPWLATWLKGICWLLPCSVLITFHVRSVHTRKVLFGVPYSVTLMRTESGRIHSIVLHLKGATTDFAGFCNHAFIVPSCLAKVIGSGSAGVACKRTGRKFIGMENNENYYNLAVTRIGEV